MKKQNWQDFATTTILFREDNDNQKELEIARQHLDVYTNRSALPFSMVIGRYSVLPFYKELEKDLDQTNGSFLVNSFEEHSMVSDISLWYPHLESLTFKTYFNIEEIPLDEPGSFVVKGLINSRKHSWNRKMFAKDRASLGLIMSELMDDPLIAPQGICIRKFEKLETFITGINDLPITNEFRIFVLNKKIVAHGYYWASYELDIKEKLGNIPTLRQYPEVWNFIYSIKRVVDQFCSFYVMDVAKTDKGDWILVELNDAQQSGLATIDPNWFYANIGSIINGIDDIK